MGTEVIRVKELSEIEPEECWKLLRLTTVGRLAVSVRNRPDIFPVNYAVDDKGDMSIVINTAPGTKLAAAVLGRGVAFEVDVLDPITRSGWSVVLKGPALEVEELPDLLEVEALELETWSSADKSRYLRLVPNSVTGRRI
ncbi:MAG: pyridoxamine 5'-phosphate oxidase family protein [Acidimicrobiales bacterium]